MEKNAPLVPPALRAYFAARERVALAFSGGCDSAYLLYAARACGADFQAYYVHSCFQPAFELRDAQRLAREQNAPLKVLEVDVLQNEAVRENPPNRCYYCKREIFSAICRAAQADGYACIADGTNASDDIQSRPGVRALEELRVESPLRLCGMTKQEVRALSREAGLFTWDKPAYACLATRIPTGMPCTQELLQKVEAAENALYALGFRDFRVRITREGCRLELLQAQMPLVMAQREAVLEALNHDFEEITLNLKPRERREV